MKKKKWIALILVLCLLIPSLAYATHYAEGKLEEYLNVSEMNPGEKYRILYDMKSGLVLDVQTTERK